MPATTRAQPARGRDAQPPEQACVSFAFIDNHSHLRFHTRMYICLCNAVTDHDIRREAADGVHSFAELQARTGCSDCCGCCEQEARDTLAKAVEKLMPQGTAVAAA
jgi:bacterioferritin-associated ferredoxin